MLINTANVGQEVVERLRCALGDGVFRLHEPLFDGREKDYLLDCVNSSFVSSIGPYVERFEAEIATFTGAKHAVAVVNGTAALQVALKLAGVQAGDEVIVPALTFVATANAVAHLYATPHFADTDLTLGLDPIALRDWLNHVGERVDGGCRNKHTGRRIRAVVPMHTFGHACKMEGLLAVAQDFGLELVEDAAESLGTYYSGKHTGTFGRLGVLSFNGNKVITTGGGGAILTDDVDLAERAKHITTTAKIPHGWEYVHDAVGYNYRMPNLNAALGCAQLEQLPLFLASKRRLFAQYQRSFNDLEYVQLLAEPAGSTSNYWLQTLILDEKIAKQRHELLEATNAAGYMTRPAWQLLNTLPMFREVPCAPLPIAESLALRIVNLPSSAGLA